MNKAVQKYKGQLLERRDAYAKQLDKQKEELVRTLNDYREVIDEKVAQSKKAVDWGKKGLLVMGGIYIVFKLSEWLIWGGAEATDENISKETPSAPKPPSQESRIVREIKSQIASFLLSVAKKELMRLIEDWKKKNEGK